MKDDGVSDEVRVTVGRFKKQSKQLLQANLTMIQEHEEERKHLTFHHHHHHGGLGKHHLGHHGDKHSDNYERRANRRDSIRRDSMGSSGQFRLTEVEEFG